MLGQKITGMMKKIIHVPYYYVEPCPVCESKKTGQLFFSHPHDGRWEIREALKHGEIMAEFEGDEMPYRNAFCLACGSFWHHDRIVSFMSLARIDEEKKARGTELLYQNEYEAYCTEEKERYKKKGFLIGHIAKFIGKI